MKRKRVAKRKKGIPKRVLSAIKRGRKILRNKKKPGSKKAFRKIYKVIMAGRKTKKRGRRKRYISPALEPIIITKGEIMSGKKHRRKHRRMRFEGFEGRGRRSRRRSRRYYGGEKVNIQNLMGKGALAVVGGVGASMAAQFIPVKEPKIKALIPIGIGAVLAALPMTRRNKWAQSIALGSVVVGALSLVRHLAPNLPLLTGDEYRGDQLYIPQGAEAQAMLGYPFEGEQYQGEVMQEEAYQGEAMQGNLDGDISGNLDGEVMSE